MSDHDEVDEAPKSSPWLTVKEAAARARVGHKAIYDAVATGKCRAVKVGNGFRLHWTWVDAWLNAQATVINPDAPGEAIPFKQGQTTVRYRPRR